MQSYGFVNDKESKELCKLINDAVIDISSKPAYLIDGYISKKGIMCIISIKDTCFYCLGEVYRLGLILSQFFASFASINSFCELRIKCIDSKEILHCPAVNGNKALL